MTHCKLSVLVAAVLCAPLAAQSESADPCAALAGLRIDGVEITKAALVSAGTTVPPPYPGAPGLGPFPAHCRVDGIINRRKGIDGQEFGIGFALALPEPATWNGDFMMQGGGGGNGIVAYAMDPIPIPFRAKWSPSCVSGVKFSQVRRTTSRS